jgi:hypothetical protein
MWTPVTAGQRQLADDADGDRRIGEPSGGEHTNRSPAFAYPKRKATRAYAWRTAFGVNAVPGCHLSRPEY